MRDINVVVVDYGMGNIRSVCNKIVRSGYNPIVTNDINVIKGAAKLILPGVGHFSNGMLRLNELNLLPLLHQKVIVEKTPILGICLGMQLFTRHSEEGGCEGLGWFNADTVKFTLTDIRHKVPHMGWNILVQKKSSVLLDQIPLESSFYFVHSYHVKCLDEHDILTTTTYGYEFASSIQKDNIFGVQFHPEKSHLSGELLLRNFLSI